MRHMSELKLIKPTADLKEAYLDMLAEWRASGEELVPWTLNLDPGDFDHLVDTLNAYNKGLNLPAGFVPSTSLWLVDGQRMLGAVDIRHCLTPSLAYRGGHIGYGIRPDERRKGYASQMLRLALQDCRSITNNGAILDSEDLDDGRAFLRFWIQL